MTMHYVAPPSPSSTQPRHRDTYNLSIIEALSCLVVLVEVLGVGVVCLAAMVGLRSAWSSRLRSCAVAAGGFVDGDDNLFGRLGDLVVDCADGERSCQTACQ